MTSALSSQDYRFLPELLMPIVTINEEQNIENPEERNSSDNAKIKLEEDQELSESFQQNKESQVEISSKRNNNISSITPKVEEEIGRVEISSLDDIKVKEEAVEPDESISKCESPLEKNTTETSGKQTGENDSELNPDDKVNLDVKKETDEVQKTSENCYNTRRKRGRPRKYVTDVVCKTTVQEKSKIDEVGVKKKTRKQKKGIKSKSSSKKTSAKDISPVEIIPKYSCPICKDDAKRTEKELRSHYKNDHGGRRLRTSMLSNEIVPCDVCGKQFRSAYHLKEHMETHNNCYNCEICDSSHKKLLDYVIHMRIHSDKGLFKCIYCEFLTENITQITEHITGGHEQSVKYTCGICKKGFHIYSWFEEHQNYHEGLKPFSCDICNKSFMYSRYLSAHKNIMHKDLNNPNLHECVICHKQYQHRNSLKLHMNNHTGNFAICDVCGKILSSREKLKFHMRTHTGYKPFNCPYCGKCFTKKPILVEHIRIHTGERPYVCEYCTKAFSQRSSLVIHIRSHTGERPFVCHFCQRGFVAKAMLNIHLRTCKGFGM